MSLRRASPCLLYTSSQFLREALPQVPDVVVILGSGWGDFAQQLVQPIVIPYPVSYTHLLQACYRFAVGGLRGRY